MSRIQKPRGIETYFKDKTMLNKNEGLFLNNYLKTNFNKETMSWKKDKLIQSVG